MENNKQRGMLYSPRLVTNRPTLYENIRGALILLVKCKRYVSLKHMSKCESLQLKWLLCRWILNIKTQTP